MTALPAVNTLRPTISTDNNLLALSNLADIAVAGLDSPHSRRVYSAHLRRFFAYAQGRRLERALVQGWLGYVRQGGSGVAGRNQALSAVKMLVREAEVRGVVDSQLAYTIVTIKQAKSSGGKVGRWLNLAEVGQLISAAALVNPEQALRNTALVALLVGCGLRRTEAVTLRWPQWRKADGRWIVADIVGKGNKRRTVPANKWVGEIVNDYHAVAHACAGACSDSEDSHEPLLFPFTPQQAYTIVSRAAAIAGLGEVRPHDLRRTYAKLSRASGAQIEQISVALGHSSVVTTEKYLGSRLELAAGKACGDAIADPRERTD